MTDYREPTPDIFDICVVINEATDALLGTNLIPYAERIKAIVIESLFQEPSNSAFFHAISMDRHFDETMVHLISDLEGVSRNYNELLSRMRRHWADTIGIELEP